LTFGRHVSHFIQKQCAALGHLESAGAVGVRARERAFDVAKQFGLQQLLGQRGAVDGDERFVAAQALLVDGAGDQFLAGAALALDEDGHIARGDFFDELADGAHGFRGAEERAGFGTPLQPQPQFFVFSNHRLIFKRLANKGA
jgi:hypothetical protein